MLARLTKSSLLWLALLSLFCPAVFSMDLGRAWVEPETGTVNEVGDWTVHYEVGQMGIAVGGGIRVQFPNAWFVHPWAKRKDVQTDNPELPHYVFARTNRVGAQLEVKIGKEGVDGQHDRFEKGFDVIVGGKDLLPGDRISVVFARTPVPVVAETDSIGVGVDAAGNKTFIPLDVFPEFTVKAAEAQKLLVLLPSHARVGESVQLRVVALDSRNNRADSYRGKIEITGMGLEERQTRLFSETDGGLYLTAVPCSQPGVFTVKVRDKRLAEGVPFESNPIQVTAEEIELKAYWGDLHSHCEISKDAIGKAETAFLNARDVFGLDFYALTDHTMGDKKSLDDWWEGILPEEWQLTQSLVRTFYEPHRFVTFLAYEWSCPAPYGHHNVYCRNDTEPFFDLKHHPTIEDLWARLENKQAFTVPHHTGIMWRGINSPFVDWSHQNDRLRPAVEIYSLHGASEYFNNPMKYEDFDFTPTTSNFGPYYARDGWAAGNYLGTVSGSDNHTAHPGQPYGGLTCILAPELTRDALFGAVMKRHTYATTGARILLDFEINGHMMGERFALASGEKPRITIEVVGTAPLEYVELMRFSGDGWTTACRWEPKADSRRAKVSWTDEDLSDARIYYCRLKQKGQFFGRDVMAWSSPIWVGDTFGNK